MLKLSKVTKVIIKLPGPAPYPLPHTVYRQMSRFGWASPSDKVSANEKVVQWSGAWRGQGTRVDYLAGDLSGVLKLTVTVPLFVPLLIG